MTTHALRRKNHARLSAGPEHDSGKAMDPAAVRSILQAVRTHQGSIVSDDPLLREPGVRLEPRARAATVRLTHEGRFSCLADVRVYDLETWIEDGEATVTGRVDGDSVSIDAVAIHALAS